MAEHDGDLAEDISAPTTSSVEDNATPLWRYLMGVPLILAGILLLMVLAPAGASGLMAIALALPGITSWAVGQAVISTRSHMGTTVSVSLAGVLLVVLFVLLSGLSSICFVCK